MTLSDKKHWMKHIKTNQCCESYTQEDVKEFIKALKELIKNNWRQDINEQINNE